MARRAAIYSRHPAGYDYTIFNIGGNNYRLITAIHLPLSVFKKPNNLAEYSKLEKILDELIDEVRGNEKHPFSQTHYS